MSSLIIDIETIKSQMKMLQESLEASMSVSAAICQEAFNKRDHPPPVNNTPNSPIVSMAATPQQRRNRHQPSPAPQSPPDVSTPTHTDTIDENGEDPEDVLRLARIQDRLPSAKTPSGESIMSETPYASVVRREQLASNDEVWLFLLTALIVGTVIILTITNREQLIRTNPEQDQK